MRITQVRDTSKVGLGLLVATGSTYLLHALAARILTTDEFGLFGTYWSLLFTGVIIAYLAVEQSVAARVASTTEVPLGRDFLFSLTLISLGTGGLLSVAAFLVDGESQVLNVLLLGLASVGYAPVYLTRGALAGQRRFSFYGVVFAGESIARLGTFLLLVSIGLDAFRALIVSLLMAPIVVIAVALPTTLRNKVDRSRWVGSLQTIGGALVANIGLVVFVNLGPVIVTARGTTEQSAVLFAALLVVRAPLFLFQSVVVTVLPRLVDRIERQGEDAVARSVRRWVLLLVPPLAILAAVSAPVVAWVAGLVFGESLVPSIPILALLAVGIVFVIASLLVDQFLIASERTSSIAQSWGIGILLFISISLMLGDALWAVATGLAIATGFVLTDLVMRGCRTR